LDIEHRGRCRLGEGRSARFQSLSLRSSHRVEWGHRSGGAQPRKQRHQPHFLLLRRGGTDAHTDAHAYAYTHTDTHSDTDAHTDGHTNGHTDTHADGYAYGDTNGDTNADTHAHAAAYTDTYPSANVDARPNDNAYADTIAYTHLYAHASSLAGGSDSNTGAICYPDNTAWHASCTSSDRR
jgi:hypothetical protein